MAVRKRIIFGKNRNPRSAGPAHFRAKRGREPGDTGLDLQTETGRCFGELFGGKMLFELEFGMVVNGTADCDCRFTKIVDRAADALMRFHAESSALRNSIGAANESIRPYGRQPDQTC